MNNNKGFSLVELLVVVVVMALIMIVVVPSINNIFKKNEEKKYVSYETMMVEYAKYDNPKKLTQNNGLCNLTKSHPELKDINEKCVGYVETKDHEFKAYLYCDSGKYETVKDHYKSNSSKYTSCK